METVTLELDAYEIASNVFSDNGELDNNFTFEDVDLKTLFEMLLIIFTEGLKKYHGNEDNTVNLCDLVQEDIDKIYSWQKRMKSNDPFGEGRLTTIFSNNCSTP